MRRGVDSNAGQYLKFVHGRDRAIALGVPWVVTPEQKMRRAALAAEVYAEPRSMTGGWPFSGHDDAELSTLDRSEYQRRLRLAHKIKAARQAVETQRAAAPTQSFEVSVPDAGRTNS
jgi:hypothetical protein